MTTLAAILVLTAAVSLASAGLRYRRHLAAWWARLTRRRTVETDRTITVPGTSSEYPDGIVTIPGALSEQQEAAFRAQWEAPGGPATGEWRYNVRRLPRGGRSER